MKGILYCIENSINQKQYIGKTYGTIEERWRQHLEESSKDRSSNRPLYRAINKYGKENFEIFSLGTYEEGFLEDAEINAIILYKTYAGDGSGYNATLGGDGRRYLDDEAIIKSYYNLQNATQVSLLNGCHIDSVINILKYNNIPIISGGDVTKSKMGKPVHMLDINTGDILKTFSSQMDAARYLMENGYSQAVRAEQISSKIGAVCNGKRITTGGFKWERL